MSKQILGYEITETGNFLNDGWSYNDGSVLTQEGYKLLVKVVGKLDNYTGHVISYTYVPVTNFVVDSEREEKLQANDYYGHRVLTSEQVHSEYESWELMYR
ncbi:MAG TPA: hypothetical protein VGC17_08835 [Lactovum miscens]|uniref:hypothetical protein n=1 Tax=Lactovum miscens TaxID=190387 RepID=UPI002ED8452A